MSKSPIAEYGRAERDRARAKLAGISRRLGKDHPETIAARRDFHLVRGVALLEAAQEEFRAAMNPAAVDEAEVDA